MSFVLDNRHGALLDACASYALLIALAATDGPESALLADRRADGLWTRLAAGSRGMGGAHRGGGFSALPAHKAWRSRSQGNIAAQQWELLESPWKLVLHNIMVAMAWQDKANSSRAYAMSRKDKRRLDNARARASQANSVS